MFGQGEAISELVGVFCRLLIPGRWGVYCRLLIPGGCVGRVWEKFGQLAGIVWGPTAPFIVCACDRRGVSSRVSVGVRVGVCNASA